MPNVRITLIQSCKQFYKECTFKRLSTFLFFPKSNYNKHLFDSLIIDFIVDFSRLSIAKSTEKDLQKIFRLVLKTQALFFNELCKKLFKIKSPNLYCGKSHIEFYNFYQ